jgi:hypothetical protein
VVKEMSIESVRLSLMNYQRVVVLREKGSDRYLPIWIGPAEADAIAVRLQDVSVSRPLTHDLLRNLIEQLGGHVQHVIVTHVSNDTFFARIVVQLNDETLEVDSRPSDALALAVRAEVPIYAEDAVLDTVGVRLDEESESAEEVAASRPRPADPAEIERLGAFKDFIEGLDLSGLDDSDR